MTAFIILSALPLVAPIILWLLKAGRHGAEVRLEFVVWWNSVTIAWQFFKMLRRADRSHRTVELFDRLEAVLVSYLASNAHARSMWSERDDAR